MSTLNNYKVTITIESVEEKEDMEFLVEANSFDEAVLNLRNDVDKLMFGSEKPSLADQLAAAEQRAGTVQTEAPVKDNER